jgi:energy-coupling factor transport system permease protein
VTAPGMRAAAGGEGFARLDFRAKLALFVAVSALAVLCDRPVASVGIMAAALGGCLAAGISRAYLGLMFRVMTPFFVLMLLTHGFFNVGHVKRLTGAEALTTLWAIPDWLPVLGGVALSREGLLYGVNVLAKSMTFLLMVPLVVFTTQIDNLVVGLVKLRVPYRLAFVLSSTLRFFPLLFGEIQAVKETQRLRGFALEEMRAMERVKTYAKVAVPVILGSMFKAQQLEVVLQAKAFSGRGARTYLHESRLGAAEWAVIAASAAVFAAGGVLLAKTRWLDFGGGW